MSKLAKTHFISILEKNGIADFYLHGKGTLFHLQVSDGMEFHKLIEHLPDDRRLVAVGISDNEQKITSFYEDLKIFLRKEDLSVSVIGWGLVEDALSENFSKSTESLALFMSEDEHFRFYNPTKNIETVNRNSKFIPYHLIPFSIATLPLIFFPVDFNKTWYLLLYVVGLFLQCGSSSSKRFEQYSKLENNIITLLFFVCPLLNVILIVCLRYLIYGY